MPAPSVPPAAAEAVTDPAFPLPGTNAAIGFDQQLRTLFDAVSSIFSRGDALADPQNLVAGIQKLGVVWGIVFVIVGLLCLFNGYKWYRVTTIGLALILGLFAGYILGQHIGAPFIVAGCLGALCFAVAFPLLKYAVAALGGLAGAFIGANTWHALALGINNVVGPELGPGRRLLGRRPRGPDVLRHARLHPLQASRSSCTPRRPGSTIAVIGTLALLLSIEPWQQAVIAALTDSPAVVPILVFVPAVIGLILQHSGPAQPAGRAGAIGPAAGAGAPRAKAA